MVKSQQVDQFLFGLTGSEAKTPAAQRAAITRAGLDGHTRASVRKVQLASWKKLRAENPRVPAYVLGRQHRYDPWQTATPVGMPIGFVRSCKALRSMAYDLADWGRDRKRGVGEATCMTAHIEETDNGKTGWDRVVNRAANYGCVLSPDKTKLCVSVRYGRWVEVRCFRGWFRFNGQILRLDQPEPKRAVRRLRDVAEMLRRAGWTVRFGYQTAEQVSAGSGVVTRQEPGKQLQCVVDFGDFGVYHCTTSTTLADVASRLAARRHSARQSQIDAAIAAGKVVFVGVDDSLASGNCQPGTEAFANQLRQQFGDDAAAIRSDVLLRVRDDHFTRRAVVCAFIRRGY